MKLNFWLKFADKCPERNSDGRNNFIAKNKNTQKHKFLCGRAEIKIYKLLCKIHDLKYK